MPKLSEAGKHALDELVAQTAREGRLPGFVLAVSNVDEQIYANAAGNRVYGDPSSPAVTPEDSVFWICSMTKLLAALAALQLIEQGKLAFDTPVSKFFKEFESAVVLQDPHTDPDPKFKPAEKAVTVNHLITHSSGLYYGTLPTDTSAIRHRLPIGYTFEYEEGEDKYSKFFEQVKGKYPGIPLIFEPGTAFCYGYSSDVLGFIVEKVSGQSLEAYSQQHIFGPLGVKNTYHLTAELRERLVELCFRNPDGSISGWEDRLPLIPRYPKPVAMNLGGVGSYSTLPDYLAILRHLLQIEAGRNPPNAILKQETVKSLFQPKLTPLGGQMLTAIVGFLDPSSAHDLDWGNGFAVNTADWEGRRKAGSGFWSGWAGTWYFLDPKTGIALVFGSQIVPPMDVVTAEIAEKAERIVYANLED
ncbi:beta-lactamase [Coprinopsis cinerea okayama7|uniref:Beta-lactamase n=1 Tax=Coprinopsis cinerea (strain Okayama-7 / 130 / ATCC MYA-4618 / FGSC 9003) TaxID=240176 RepID=A8P5V4_COPC7|nr:beta-lactamase [Coprinopsis cinerea okayama7\|eukprot:XP_001839030.1 beta-lactamase [Coprinopsis cinerea okayama7\